VAAIEVVAGIVVVGIVVGFMVVAVVVGTDVTVVGIVVVVRLRFRALQNLRLAVCCIGM
jgi:hypothetical protein